MALIACNECGGEVSTKAKACPKCGSKMPRTKWWLWIPLGLVAVFFGFGMVAGNSPEAQAKARDRAAIDMCWSEQKRKSFDAGTQRFVAGACEMMEANFVRDHGHRP